MATETVVAEQWIYGTLSGDEVLTGLVSGRVFAYRVPQGSMFPCVVFMLQGAEADTRVGRTRIASRMAYAVKAVGRDSDFQALQPIADRIDVLLAGSSGSVGDSSVALCVRDNPIEYLENGDSGQDYAHLGGVYRLIVTG